MKWFLGALAPFGVLLMSGLLVFALLTQSRKGFGSGSATNAVAPEVASQAQMAVTETRLLEVPSSVSLRPETAFSPLTNTLPFLLKTVLVVLVLTILFSLFSKIFPAIKVSQPPILSVSKISLTPFWCAVVLIGYLVLFEQPLEPMWVPTTALWLICIVIGWYDTAQTAIKTAISVFRSGDLPFRPPKIESKNPIKQFLWESLIMIFDAFLSIPHQLFLVFAIMLYQPFLGTELALVVGILGFASGDLFGGIVGFWIGVGKAVPIGKVLAKLFGEADMSAFFKASAQAQAQAVATQGSENSSAGPA